MPGQQRLFRIEQITQQRGSAAPAGEDIEIAIRHSEIMTEFKALRTLLDPNSPSASAAAAAAAEPLLAQRNELRKLKTELDLVYDAISRTKQEIATLHVTGFNGPEMTRVTNELDAVVGGTEAATQKILSAAEDIDQMANTLSASVRSEHEQALAQDIQDRVVQIFEACNFQDLTGQRIAKVASTLKFIEEHVVRMMEIWGGIDAFSDFSPEAIAARDGDASLLNGPKLEGEDGHASQNDIDALFN